MQCNISDVTSTKIFQNGYRTQISDSTRCGIKSDAWRLCWEIQIHCSEVLPKVANVNSQ